MRLGVQYSEPGAKYPFDENAENVSAYTSADLSRLDGKIPCDLFSDVTVDCEIEGVFALESIAGGDKLVFSWSVGVGAVAETFTLTSRDFNSRGQAMFVFGGAEKAIVRIKTGIALWDVLFSLYDMYSTAFSSSNLHIVFDSRCTRISEKRLSSFVVDGQRVSGDVIFKAGYNTDLSLYDQDNAENAIELDLSAGGGEGFSPCPEPENSFAGLLPGADGGIRIEADDCYSVVPVAKNRLDVIGHCSACCSCEGDYLPVAIAANKLINRLVSTDPNNPGVYSRLKDIRAAYERYIRYEAPQQTIKFAVTSVARWSLMEKVGNAYVGFAISNFTKEQITITQMQIVAGNRVISNFNSRFFKSYGIKETSRQLQVGEVLRFDLNARVPFDIPASQVAQGFVNVRLDLENVDIPEEDEDPVTGLDVASVRSGHVYVVSTVGTTLSEFSTVR